MEKKYVKMAVPVLKKYVLRFLLNVSLRLGFAVDIDVVAAVVVFVMSKS